jgi:GT2 family glycosyltransferase
MRAVLRKKGEFMPRRSRIDHRALLHQLNQRYYREWLRAERLERDLLRIRGRWFGPLIACACAVKRWFFPVRDETFSFSACPSIDESTDPPGGKVSILIPFKDRLELLRTCLRSLRRTGYTDVEIILVDNGSRDPRMRRYLRHLTDRGRAIVVSRPGPFNFSWLCNQGARAARGDHLLFLNNDTEVITPDWLERMLRLAARPEVGIVGALLLYPDKTIQHAGLFPTTDGRWVHAGRGQPATTPEVQSIRSVPAVTGACMLVRRSLFEEMGGFDEKLPVTHNDVDLCCRARQRGLHIALTPHARLVHYEGLTRGFTLEERVKGHVMKS